MPYLIKLLGLCFLLPSLTPAAELETQLNKISFIKNLNSSSDDNPDSKKIGEAFKMYMEKRKQAPDPNEEAKLYYESNVDAKPCTHCPKYLNLTLAVNKIVEKAKENKDVALENETFIQLNKLKFLYYVVRSEAENGDVKCRKLGDNIIRPTKIDGKISTLSDTIFKLSDVTDFQFIPQGAEQVYYYYRGEGVNSNIIIEVMMNRDGSSRLRYYEYDAADGSTKYLKAIQKEKKALANKPKEAPKDNYFDLGFDVKTKDSVVPSDISLLKAGAKTQLSEDLNLKLKSENSVNEQTASVAFERENGKRWLVIEGKNITDGGKSLKTVVPMEINLDKASALNVNASLENNVAAETISEAIKGKVASTQALNLGLTDHNHEYFNVRAEVDLNGDRAFTASNRFSLGNDNSVGSSVQIDRAGNRSFSINNVTNLNDYGKFTTSFGTTSDRKKFVETQYENKISERTSLVIGARLSDEKSVSLLFQTKF